MLQNDDSNLETIINAIDNIKSLNENMKTTIKQFFIALQKTNTEGYKELMGTNLTSNNFLITVPKNIIHI